MASFSASGSGNSPGELILKVRPFEHSVQALGVALMAARLVPQQRPANRSGTWPVDEPELPV